jgi:thymidylate synthase (FAD)
MKITLMAHTQLSEKFLEELSAIEWFSNTGFISDGQAVALSAIRTCYSPNKPSEIVAKEGDKYFRKAATDGEGGTEADRLIRTIMRSKHVSTIEHISFTFSVEGVSRALLAQLTRHRVGFSFSVQSQRYVKFGSGDRSEGFDYVVPEKVLNNENKDEFNFTAEMIFEDFMKASQEYYDILRELGVPAEDARSVLPNAAATNLVMTVNLRALLDFYAKRKAGRGGQHEITQLAERLREEVVAVEGWTDKFFEEV